MSDASTLSPLPLAGGDGGGPGFVNRTCPPLTPPASGRGTWSPQLGRRNLGIAGGRGRGPAFHFLELLALGLLDEGLDQEEADQRAGGVEGVSRGEAEVGGHPREDLHHHE